VRYILLILLGYFVINRLFRTKDKPKVPKPNQPIEKDNHGGEYVDYEEID
jgi:hypothetical protein